MIKKVPTKEFYDSLQEVYNTFNLELFDNELPNCIITMQRLRNVMGYFSENRWIDKEGEKAHEIALNPSYFISCPLIEILQTIAHEMCHLWQFEHGAPSKRTYHNNEWSKKMLSIGLIPSQTGREGGKQTGQKMSEYVQRGGLFENTCIKLAGEEFIKWFNRVPCEHNRIIVSEDLSEEKIVVDEEIVDEVDESDHNTLDALYTNISTIIEDTVSFDKVVAKRQSTTKRKYTCRCGSSVWGKPHLSIKCNLCDSDFTDTSLTVSV